jgi:hypothetical protein
MFDNAKIQEVTRWLLTAKHQVQSQSNSSRICGAQCGTGGEEGSRFLLNGGFPLPTIIPLTTNTHLSLTVDTTDPSAAAVPSPATHYIYVMSSLHMRKFLNPFKTTNILTI